jgi:hypothetical protein
MARLGIILAIYRSPAITNADVFVNSLHSHLEQIKSYKCLILVGDININLIYDPDEQCYTRENRLSYLNMLSKHNILKGHSFPTREDSCLDHIMLKLDKSSLRARVSVLNSSITDHSMTFLHLANVNVNSNNLKLKLVTDFDKALDSLKCKKLSD